MCIVRNSRRPIVFFAALLLAACPLRAQVHFDGGMMVHTGYLSASLPAGGYDAAGVPFGIGGTMRIHLGPVVRLGGEGFISTLSLMDNGSYVRIGWGGVVAEARWKIGRWHPFAGATLGGGSANSLLVFNGDTDDWLAEPNTVFHTESFMLVDPHLGVEYALTERIVLTSRLSWLLPLRSVDVPLGPRLFVGFVFNH